MPDANADNIARLKGLREDYKKVFTTEEGKRVLKDLARVCFYNTTTIANDPNMTAFNEGNRAVYLHINTILDMDIDELVRMNLANVQQ